MGVVIINSINNNHKLDLSSKQTAGVKYIIHNSNECVSINGVGNCYITQLVLKDGKRWKKLIRVKEDMLGS